MSNYGRNFEFRVPPLSGQRGGRYVTPAAGSKLPIGVPITVDTSAGFNSLGLQIVKLASSNTYKPESGRSGILVYEYAPNAFAGDDQFLVTYSDKDTAPLAAPCQMVSGDTVKVVLRNTFDRTFLGSTAYTGRVMFALLGATPTVTVGDYMLPHASPSGSNGYWDKTSTAADAWLLVTKIDNARHEVEARLLF